MVETKLGRELAVSEIELALKLGLLCCNDSEERRPTMRQVVEYSNGEHPLSKLTCVILD